MFNKNVLYLFLAVLAIFVLASIFIPGFLALMVEKFNCMFNSYTCVRVTP